MVKTYFKNKERERVLLHPHYRALRMAHDELIKINEKENMEKLQQEKDFKQKELFYKAEINVLKKTYKEFTEMEVAE